MKYFFYSLNMLLLVIITAGSCMASSNLGGVVYSAKDDPELFYIDPASRYKYCLNSSYDTFQVMRGLGLGIRHSLLQKYSNSTFPYYLSGKILLDVQKKGQAYYIDPKNRKSISLGDPDTAYVKISKAAQPVTEGNLARVKMNPQDCNYNPDEIVFRRSYDIMWSGKIIGNMNGFHDFGIERLNKNTKYPYFYATIDWEGSNMQKTDIIAGNVRIYGKMIGITCAYQNTVFSGKCVPEINITKIKKVR